MCTKGEREAYFFKDVYSNSENIAGNKDDKRTAQVLKGQSRFSVSFVDFQTFAGQWHIQFLPVRD